MEAGISSWMYGSKARREGLPGDRYMNAYESHARVTRMQGHGTSEMLQSALIRLRCGDKQSPHFCGL